MMRRTSMLPVAVYTYGCHHKGILAGAELAEDQYGKAHAYRERLVDIELDRRRKVREILAAGPDVAAPAAALKAAEDEVAVHTTVALSIRKATRKAPLPKELKDKLAAAKAAVRAAREVSRAARRAAAKDLAVKARLDVVEAESRAAVKAARAASGLYWGTYLILERSADQQRMERRDPRHRPPGGDGQIAVQIQKGMPVGKLADDPRLRMVPIEGPRGGMRSRGKHLERLMIRAGTVEGGRAPLWVEIEVVVHRPLPADARITWAALKRRRDGRRWRYSLHVTVEAASLRPAQVLRSGSMVAVDLGWRVMRDDAGGMRVGTWRTDDGRTGEVRLPPRLLSGLAHADELLRVEEHWFEMMRGELAAWVAGRGEAVPAEHRARLENLPLWKSAMRLSQVVWWWREHRFSGDEEIYGLADTWRRRRFWHYRDWSRSEREKNLARRLDIYRNAAVEIMRGVAELVVEDFDLRVYARKPGLESEKKVPAELRHALSTAAPGLLRQCLIMVARRQGTAVTVVNPAMTTTRCRECGSEAKWDPVSDVRHACEACGKEWDQDDNACSNMLAIAAGGGGGRGEERGGSEDLERGAGEPVATGEGAA